MPILNLSVNAKMLNGYEQQRSQSAKDQHIARFPFHYLVKDASSGLQQPKPAVHASA